MEVRTTSNSATFLLTSDAYYPGWRATIDGQETKLYRADYAIRGVALIPGQHLVSFLYRPKAFYLGAAISVLTLLGLCIIVVAIHKRHLRPAWRLSKNSRLFRLTSLKKRIESGH
jgi:uncharacterized membrane protein YfhO